MTEKLIENDNDRENDPRSINGKIANQMVQQLHVLLEISEVSLLSKFHQLVSLHNASQEMEHVKQEISIH